MTSDVPSLAYWTKGCIRKVLIPFGVASKEVCGEKTDMPFADRRSKDAWSGSSSVKDLSPRKICDIRYSLYVYRESLQVGDRRR